MENEKLVEVTPPVPVPEDKINEIVQKAKDELKGEFETRLKQKEKQFNYEASKYHKRAEQAESQLATLAELARVNPQLSAQIRQAMTSAQAKALQDREASDRVEQEKQDFYSNVTESIKELELDPNDKRLDWAEDAKNATEATRRIMASLAKIQKEDKTVWQKKMEKQLEEKFANLRKEAGMDTVETSSSGGTSQTGLGGVLSRAKSPKEAREALDKYIRE